MSLGSDIIAALVPGVFAADRLTPDVPKDNPQFPLCIWQRVGGPALNTLEAVVPGLHCARVQFVVWSATRKEADEKALALRAALASTMKADALSEPVGTYDTTTKKYGNRFDFYIWHTP